MVDPLFISAEQKSKLIQDLFMLDSESTRNMLEGIEIVKKADSVLKSAANDELKAEAREKMKIAYQNFLSSINPYNLHLLTAIITRVDVIKDMYKQCKTKDDFNKNYIHNTIDILRRRSRGEVIPEPQLLDVDKIKINEVINKNKN